jgi:hypothetical protein
MSGGTLSGTEIVELSEAIKLAYDYSELSMLLLKMDRGDITDYVNANSDYPSQVQQLVGRFDKKGWIQDLLDAAVKDRPKNQAIQNFLSRNRYWDPANHPILAHPADTLRVSGGQSFIGRDKLRRILKKMEKENSRKVLVVTSAHRKVGKTYSEDLIRFVSRKLQPSQVAHADLDSDTYTPITLTKELAKEMKLDTSLIPDKATEQAPRFNQELVNFLIPNTLTIAQTVWIILDGFREQIPSEAIQDFIVQLAQRIKDTEEFRLILLNYTYSLPLTVGGFSFTDELQPLTPEELEIHFTRVHRQKYNTDPSQKQLADYLAWMNAYLTKYTQENPTLVNDQTFLLNVAVSAVAETIEEGL